MIGDDDDDDSDDDVMIMAVVMVMMMIKNDAVVDDIVTFDFDRGGGYVHDVDAIDVELLML